MTVLYTYDIISRYFCRSIEHDAMTRQCVLSEEDSVSQKDDVTVSASPTHHFYDLVCLDNREYYRDRLFAYDNS